MDIKQIISILKDIQELINSGLYNVNDIADDLLKCGAINNNPDKFDITIDNVIEILEAVKKLDNINSTNQNKGAK